MTAKTRPVADQPDNNTNIINNTTGVWAAARIHSERFHHRRIGSAFRLLNADRRVIDPAGGVATFSEGGHTIRTMLAFTLTYPTGLTATGWFIVTPPHTATAAIAIILTFTSALILGPRFDFQLRARAAFDVTDRPWVIANVATRPGHKIGDRLLGDLATRADHAHKRMVLGVDPDNGTAIRLYQRHGFTTTGQHNGKLTMHRPPTPNDPDPPVTPRPTASPTPD